MKYKYRITLMIGLNYDNEEPLNLIIVKTADNHRILFESRFEIRPDLSIIETFQDGSQLIRKRGYMIIIDSCNANISNYKLRPKISSFSNN